MRITIVQGAFLPVPPLLGGAVEKVWFALGREFVRRGHSVTHISRAYPGLAEREVIGGVEHRRLGGFAAPGSMLRLKILDLLYSLRVRLALPPADILVTNTFWLPVLVRRTGKGKLYVHVARYPKGQMKLYGHATRLQTVSTPVARAMIAQAPGLRAKIKVIPYPAPPSGTMENGVRENVILYAGRIHPEKGIDLLLEAFARFLKMPATSAPWRLRLVGPWEHHQGGGGVAYLESLRARHSALADRVEWMGPVFDAARLADCYREAALFVYPSLAETGETFGVAPLEAMSYGCPPLVSGLECFRDFITDGETGFIFDHRVSEPAAELANALARLTGSPGELTRAGRAAWEKAREFSLERVADTYLADFESLLNPAGGTSLA